MATAKIVSVGKIPGKIFELPFKKDWTVEDYFSDIDVSVDNVEIQINGVAGDLDHNVQPDDLLLAVTQVKGN
jgi:hypothetical protein